MSGIELSARFWDEAVRPILEAMAVDGCAAALLGPGSEVLGLDDERSTDHDFGPRLQVLVPDDRVDDCAEIDVRLDAALPQRFDGRAVRFATTADPVVRHRVTVTTVGGLFTELCGSDPRAGLSVSDWLALPTQVLASIADGAVLADPVGELTTARDALRWYPDDVWRYVLGCQWRRIEQREPLLGRTAEVGDARGDAIGPRLVAAGLARDLMRLAFLIERRWAPYDKWLGGSFASLAAATAVGPQLSALVGAADATGRERAYLAAGVALAERFGALGLVDAVDPAPRAFHDRPFLVLGAGRHAEACVSGTRLEVWGWRGAVDQWVDSTDVLTAPAATTNLYPGSLELPELGAGRVRLRAFAMSDLDLIRAASDDPLIPLITTVPGTYTDADGRVFIERQWDRARTGEGWSWAIATTEGDRAIGLIGLWPAKGGRAEIGYWILASERGAHAAADALEAVVAFVFDQVGIVRAELRIGPWNPPSIRTAERAGFEREGLLRAVEEIDGERWDLWMYSRLAPDSQRAEATRVAGPGMPG